MEFPIIRKYGDKIKISCKCKDEQTMEIKEYIEKTTKKAFEENKDEDNKKYKFCNIHKDKLIKKACVNCKQNLCDECVHDKNRKIKDFKELYEEIDYLKKQILEYKNDFYQSNDKKEEHKSHNCFSSGCASSKKDEFSGGQPISEKE